MISTNSIPMISVLVAKKMNKKNDKNSKLLGRGSLITDSRLAS